MDAVHIKNCVLAAFAAVGTVAAQALGGWDAAMQVLVALMAADYLTGVLVAAVWQRSRKTVWLGVLLDNALGETYIRMAVMLFFVGNEGLSLLENLGLMGVPFPAFLERALEALREQGDNGKGGSNANP